ncbi:hypothetical protein [Elioraea rosea]|uniref:hypothetical protein n=1 Tax=Elioraea rosea TaxID=2492390 RepID=UPI001184DB4A|nr:hypothetical protein [Elioraea rosea]
MMLIVFAAITLALVLDYLGLRRLAIASLSACFVLATVLFVWEVYSPEYGLRMPWLQGALEAIAKGA